MNALVALTLGSAVLGCASAALEPAPGSPDAAADPRCPEASTPNLCDSQCTNVQTDRDNCGGCGVECQSSETCMAGMCSSSACTGQPVPAATTFAFTGAAQTFVVPSCV